MNNSDSNSTIILPEGKHVTGELVQTEQGDPVSFSPEFMPSLDEYPQDVILISSGGLNTNVRVLLSPVDEDQWVFISAEVNCEEFKLPFLYPDKEETVLIGNRTQQEVFSEMKRLIPSDAIYLGRVNYVVNNWNKDVIDFSYYLIRWNEGEYKWAMFQLCWDDEGQRYYWNTIGRIKKVSDPRESAREIFKVFMLGCREDLNDPDNESFRDFLESI